MTRRGLTGLAALAVFAMFAAGATPGLAKRNVTTMQLEFTPQQAVAVVVADLGGAMLEKPVSIRIEDERKVEELDLVGTRTDDDDRLHKLRATGDDDVIDLLAEVLGDEASSWGLLVEEDAGLTLRVRLLEFEVEEVNQAVGATYDATVRVAYSLARSGGEPAASGTAVGDATRYGKKYSNANCNEVLSDALLEGLANMFSDPDLQEAWGE